MAFKSIDSSEDVNSDHAISIFFVPFSSIHIFATVFPRCDRLLPRRTTCICRLFSLESAGNTERMKHNRKASFPISLFFAAKVQRKSETAKSLAEFLVFCSYVNMSKSDEASAEQQARLIALPSRESSSALAKEREARTEQQARLIALPSRRCSSA